MDGSLEGDTVSYTTRTGSSKDLLLIDNTNGAVNGSTIGGIGTSTFVHQDAQAPSLTEFTLDLEGIEFAGSTGGANAVTFTLGTTNGTAATFGVSLGSAGSFDGKDIAKLIYDGMKDDKFQTTVNGVTFNVKLDGAKLTFTMDEDAASSITSAVTFSGNFSVGVTSGGDLTHVPGSSLIYGTVDIKEGKVASTTKYASTVVDGLAGGTLDKDSPLTFNWFTDGKGIKLGDETYVFALTDETKNAKYGEGIKVIDLTDLVDPDAVPPALKKDAVGGTEQQTLSEVAARLTQAAKDNEMWEVGATADADTTAGAKPDGTTQVIIALREKATYDGDADLTTISQIQKQVQFFDKVTVDENVTKGKGSPLTLQIGDTSESFNQLRVSIGDIHASALGVDKLNIGTQTGAQEAIDTIKNAINQISGIRGTLGATQNRLEHTQNNLSVMAENIQDAESSIRDTDIAEEMMAYTKNNI
ncbi:MAG: hypothetical protein HFF52_10100, partial [Lawsonibacter sp.]|nr:hypothetical protein [Lawsonibacter sp.]